MKDFCRNEILLFLFKFQVIEQKFELVLFMLSICVLRQDIMTFYQEKTCIPQKTS